MGKKIVLALIVAALVVTAFAVWREYGSQRDACYGKDMGRSGMYGHLIGTPVSVTYHLINFSTRATNAARKQKTTQVYILIEYERAIDCSTVSGAHKKLILKEDIITAK